MSWFTKAHVDRRVHSQTDIWTFRQILYVYSLWHWISVRVFTLQESLGSSSLVSSFPNKLSYWWCFGCSFMEKIVCFFKMLICSKEKQVMDKLSASCPMIAWHCVSTWSRFTVKLWSWGQDQSADPTCRKLFTQMISLLTSYLMYKLICTCLHYGVHLPLFNLFAEQTHNDQSSVTAAPSLVLSSREWRAASFIKECTGTILKIVSK